MATAPPTIDPLPDVPTRTIRSVFSARMDDFLAAMPPFGLQSIALAANVYTNAVEAASSATAALASGNSSATSASNAALSASAAAGSAAAAQAAAAALQSGLPAQASTHGKVLRSEQGVAVWAPERRGATQIVPTASAENELTNSSAVNCSAWVTGPNTTTVFDQISAGPNGLRSVVLNNAGSPGGQSVGWNYTPQVGVARTLSVWFRGNKPASGSLLYIAYRDAANGLQFASLPFSAVVGGDAVWRRHSLTCTHLGSNVSALPAYICVDVGAVNLAVADPQLTVGATAAGYVATGPNHLVEPNSSYDVSTVAGSVALILPDPSLGTETGATIAIKDYGRAAATNNIVIDRNGSLLEDALNNIEIDVNGVSIVLQANPRKGWLIK